MIAEAVLAGLIIHGIQESIKTHKNNKADRLAKVVMQFDAKCASERCRNHLIKDFSEHDVYKYMYEHTMHNGLSYFQKFFVDNTIQILALNRDFNEYLAK